ncbi:hypothetical protein DES43_10785 [Aquamicrobium defluvii]|uniref:Uncharacterized protein n=1 Tax=Aquamicrobium defluvii TaxID=69279 RepID=A0A4R6YH17_9HYPH|nr:hypothetical protein DES43_10785 [Aquamicrobium defluvii]
MRRKSGTGKAPADHVIKDICRATRKQYFAEEKIRIVPEGLRCEESIAALCRCEGIAESHYCSGSKEFPEAGKKRLAGDTARAAIGDEVKVLRKEVVAELALDKPAMLPARRPWRCRRLAAATAPGSCTGHGCSPARGRPAPRPTSPPGIRRRHGAHPWSALSSPDPAQDRALAPAAQAPEPARKLLPAGRSRAADRGLRRPLQPSPLPQEPRQPHIHRSLLRTRRHHQAGKEKDQTRNHRTAPLASSRSVRFMRKP